MDPNRRNFVLIALAGFLFYFGYSQLVLLPLYLDSRGVDIGTIGLLMAAMPLASMLARPFGGQFIARFGGKPVVLVSSLLYAGLIPAYMVVRPDSLWLFALLRILQGFGAAGMDNGVNFAASQCGPPSDRARSMGRASIFTVLGWALSPTVAELLYRYHGFTPLFLLGSSACLLAAAVAAGIVPSGARTALPPRLSLISYRHTLFGRNMRLLLAMGVVTGTMSGALNTFVPLYAESRGAGAGSSFYLAFCLTAVLVRVPTAGLSDRIGRRRVMIPALLLTLGVPLALLDVHSAGMIAIAGLFYGAAQGLLMPAYMAMILDTQDLDAAGAVAMGLVFMMSDAGCMLGASAFGYLSTYLGFGHSFGVFGILYLMAALFAAALREPTRSPAPLESGYPTPSH